MKIWLATRKKISRGGYPACNTDNMEAANTELTVPVLACIVEHRLAVDSSKTPVCWDPWITRWQHQPHIGDEWCQRHCQDRSHLEQHYAPQV